MPLQERRSSGLLFTEDEPPVPRPSLSTRTPSNITTNGMTSHYGGCEDGGGDYQNLAASRPTKRIKKEHRSSTSIHAHDRGKENRPPLPPHLSARYGPSSSTPRRTPSQTSTQSTQRSSSKQKTPTGGSQQKLTAFYGFAQQPQQARPTPPPSSSKVKRANPDARSRRSTSPEKQASRHMSSEPSSGRMLAPSEKGTAPAREELRQRQLSSERRDGHNYTVEKCDDAAEDSEGEDEPPSTWKQNAQKDMHIIRLLADRSRTEDDVFTQVPGRPGQKVVRDLGRQLDYDERKRQKALHDGKGARMREETIKRMKGDTVRPFNTRRPLLPSKEPDIRRKDGHGDIREVPHANEVQLQRTGGKAGPSLRSEKVDDHRSPRPLDSSDIDARINNLLKSREKHRALSGDVPINASESERRGTESQAREPIAKKPPHHKHNGGEGRPWPTPQRLRDVLSLAQPDATLASMKKGVSFAAEVETQLADMHSGSESSTQEYEERSAPDTMVSESLLRLAEGHDDADDEHAVEEAMGAAQTRTPSRTPYITNYDLGDLKATVPTHLRHVLEPGTQFPFDVHQQLERAGEKPGIRSWLLPSPTKTSTSSTMMATDEDPDRTWVNEAPPMKPALKQQTLGASLQILPSLREPEVQVETQEQMRRRFKDQAAIDDPRFDQATGTTEILSDDSDDEDADKTRVDSPAPSPEHRLEGRGISSQNLTITAPVHRPAARAGLERSSSDEMNPHADSIDSQLPLWPIGKAAHRATVQAAKNFPDALNADETQLLPFSQEGSDTQEYAGTTSSESVQLTIDRSRTRFTKHGVTQLDSQGEIVDCIRLPFVGSSGGSGSGSSP